MIDRDYEQLLTMTEAAKIIPGRPHVSTLFRWRSTGVSGIKLEVVCLGGRRTYTSREALERFFVRVTAAKNGGQAADSVTEKREREQRATRMQLIKDGLIEGDSLASDTG